MTMKLKIVIILTLFMIFYPSCQNSIIKKEKEKMFYEAESMYPNSISLSTLNWAIVNDVTLTFKDDNIDTSKVRELHQVLFDKKTQVGWKILNIFDKKKDYLFSHSSDREIFYNQEFSDHPD